MTITIDATYEGGVLIPAQPLPLQEREKVRVTVEPLAPTPKRPHDEVIAEIWERQKARGYQPPTRPSGLLMASSMGRPSASSSGRER